MDEQAYTWASEADRKKDLRHKKIGTFKMLIKMHFHSFTWRFLHLTGFARPYTKLTCRLNLYRTFLDGRCMWCGNKHGKVK